MQSGSSRSVKVVIFQGNSIAQRGILEIYEAFCVLRFNRPLFCDMHPGPQRLSKSVQA